MVFISPTIINNGHLLIVSAQKIAYMTHKTDNSYFDGIEFSRLFAGQDAQNLKITSALRMNATFPYISPMHPFIGPYRAWGALMKFGTARPMRRIAPVW